MTPFYERDDVRLFLGDCRKVLAQLPAESVQCCVTSPPYWGLRDYGIDGQLGLERTPEEYVARMVEVFREARRVLRPDGTLWLNLGDSYAGGGCGARDDERWPKQSRNDHMPKHAKKAWLTGGAKTGHTARRARECGGAGPTLKPKDLVGIPWRVAFALQADGWWLRSDIVWAKPNPMPESVIDRPTKAHEYLFLLAKSEHYFYDAEAVRERCVAGDVSGAGPEYQPPGGGPAHKGLRNRSGNKQRVYRIDAGGVPGSRAHQACGVPWEDLTGFRNRRSVWTVTTQPFDGAHFATFPPKLIEPCILAGSHAGDTVLDPFNGAGTTGLVSAKHGRRYVGIDVNASYLDMSSTRIEREASQRLLFAGGGA